MKRWLNSTLAAVAVLFLASTGATADNGQVFRTAFNAALANPFDDAAFEGFLKLLPRANTLYDSSELYLVEGDMAKTRDEVRAYLVEKST